MEKTGRTYNLGALKDKEDKRDYLIKDYLKKIPIPSTMDLSDMMMPIRDQGNEGSCVSFAACAIKESQEDFEGFLSTRNLYEKIKQEGGGAYPRDAMKVLTEYGVPPEECQLYIANTITQACQEVDRQALPNKIKGYARLSTLDEMKLCLCQTGSFMIAVAVTNNWFNVGEDGKIFEGGDIVGYHAVSFTGYDDENQQIKFKNSWGEYWGNKGYGFIGYDHFMRIVCDAWSCIDIPESEEEGNPPKPPEPTPEPTPEDTRSWLRKLSDWLLSIWNRIKNLFQEK